MAQAYVYLDGPQGWQPLAATQLPNSGVTAATYGDGTHVGQFTVTAQGIVTAASNVAITGFSAPIIVTDGTHTVNPATTIDFTSGAVVTNAGGGVADITISGSSPLTTKGDIFGYSTMDARIPVGTDGQILTSDSSQALGVRWAATTSVPGGGLGVYGDASDGAQTFDGTTTILGIVPSASTYTLARDIFLASSTINNGVTIIPNGYRIFVQGVLTNNGTIQWNGNDGTGPSSAGAAQQNTNSTINTGSTNTAPGTAGGTSTVTTGGAGSASTLTNFGGRGGTGGAGTNAAGAGGTVTAFTTKQIVPRFLPTAIIGQVYTGDAAQARLSGGTGGGAGGGDGTNRGGGGGGGGAIVILAAKQIAGTGTISANGGVGGNSTTGNTGGGGGGGGGFVIVVSSSVSGGTVSGQTVTANGGAGGAKQGTGVAGSNGSNGTVVLLPN